MSLATATAADMTTDVTTDMGTTTRGVNMGDMGGMDMMMMMYFNETFPTYFLFKQFMIDTTTDKIVVCVVTFALSILYEILKDVRAMWNKGYFGGGRITQPENDPGTGDCCGDYEDYFSTLQKGFWIRHTIQSFLHIIQVFIAFVLMLIAMTFNYYLMISLCVGNGVGYLLSGSIRFCVLGCKKSKMVKKKKKKQSREDPSSESYEQTDSIDDYNHISRYQDEIEMKYQNQSRAPHTHMTRGMPVVYDNYAMNRNFNY